MKAIVIEHAIASGFRSRKDRSLGFSISTPELTTEQKVALMDLDGLNIQVLLEPLDYRADGKVEIETEMDCKSHAERIRNALYALFKHEQETGKVSKTTLFAVYYGLKCEKILDWIKAKLPQE